jgi:hypothetical protein
MKNCPICEQPLEYKKSGTGKHFCGICVKHGIVAIIRNPIFPQVKYNIIQRIGRYMMGL